MESSFHGGTLEPHIFGGEKNLYTKAGFPPLETSLRVPPNLPQTASTWAQFIQHCLGNFFNVKKVVPLRTLALLPKNYRISIFMLLFK